MPEIQYRCNNCYEIHNNLEEAIKCEALHMPANNRREIVDNYGEAIAKIADTLCPILHGELSIGARMEYILKEIYIHQEMCKEQN